MNKTIVAVALQTLGGVMLAIAGFLVHPVVGFSAAGTIAIVFGIATERDVLLKSTKAAVVVEGEDG